MTAIIPESKCISCGKWLDAATSHEAERPETGDISICFYCGHIAAYADDLTLRNLTDDEMNAVAGDKRMLKYQWLISKK